MCQPQGFPFLPCTPLLKNSVRPFRKITLVESWQSARLPVARTTTGKAGVRPSGWGRSRSRGALGEGEGTRGAGSEGHLQGWRYPF